VERSLETIPRTVNDRFHEVIDNFLAKAKEDLEAMNREITKMENIYKKVCTFFSEDPKSMPPEEFFGIISKFSFEFQEVVKKNEELRQKKEKEAKREAARKKNELNKSNKAVNPVDPADKESAFTNILVSLQTGKQFRDRRERFQ